MVVIIYGNSRGEVTHVISCLASFVLRVGVCFLQAVLMGQALAAYHSSRLLLLDYFLLNRSNVYISNENDNTILICIHILKR